MVLVGVGPRLSAAPDSVPLDTPIMLLDTFTFNGEIAAEVRLNATAHLFDLIFVVEAWQPFSVAAPRKDFLYSSLP